MLRILGAILSQPVSDLALNLEVFVLKVRFCWLSFYLAMRFMMEHFRLLFEMLLLLPEMLLLRGNITSHWVLMNISFNTSCLWKLFIHHLVLNFYFDGMKILLVRKELHFIGLKNFSLHIGYLLSFRWRLILFLLWLDLFLNPKNIILVFFLWWFLWLGLFFIQGAFFRLLKSW